jgi:hypothetical protein
MREYQGKNSSQWKSQRQLYMKEETSSPTVSTDTLMMSILVDAWECRDIATADVAGT